MRYRLAALLILCLPGLLAAAEEAEIPTEPDEILAGLQHRYLKPRRQAVKGIAQIPAEKQKALIPRIMPLLEAKNWQTQIHAARALGAVGETAGHIGPELIARMKKAMQRPDPGLFDLLGKTLRKVLPGKNEHMPAIFRMMKTAMREQKPDLYDRLGATLKVDRAKAMPTLIAVVKEGEEGLRLLAIRALGGMKHAAAPAAPTLVEVSEDATEEVRRAIQQALNEIKKDNKPPQTERVSVTCAEGKTAAIDFPVEDADDVDYVLTVEIVEDAEHGELEMTGPTSASYTAPRGSPGRTPSRGRPRTVTTRPGRSPTRSSSSPTPPGPGSPRWSHPARGA